MPRALRSSSRIAHDLVGIILVGETLKQKGKRSSSRRFPSGARKQIVYVLHELTCAGKTAACVADLCGQPVKRCMRQKFTSDIPEALKPVMTRCATMKIVGMGNLTYISNVEDSKKLNESKQAMIIISASEY